MFMFVNNLGVTSLKGFFSFFKIPIHFNNDVMSLKGNHANPI